MVTYQNSVTSCDLVSRVACDDGSSRIPQHLSLSTIRVEDARQSGIQQARVCCVTGIEVALGDVVHVPAGQRVVDLPNRNPESPG